jgi:hypothetical protein
MARTSNTARAPRTARSAAHAAPAPAPAPGTSPVPGSAAAAVHAALTANPGATAAAIAIAAAISRPAARDALAALEAAGEATRTKGGKPGIPDTWTLAAPGPSGTGPAAGPGHDDGHAVTSRPGDDPADAEQDTSAQQEEASGAPARAGGDLGQAAQPDGDPAKGDPAEGSPDGSPAGEDTAASHEQDQAASPDGSSVPAGTPPDPALVTEIAGHIGQIQAAASAARRAARAAAGGKKAPAARPSGLREKVLAHLRDHPGGSFTPHEIHKVTGHSSGAIANALDTLVKHGDAELATEKPRRFRLAGTPAAPAGAQPPAEPGPEGTGASDETDLAGAA